MRIKRILLYTLGLPFIILFGFPVWFVTWCDDVFDCCCYNDDCNCCVKIFAVIFTFILGMILNPFVICFYILASPCFLYSKCKDY